MCSAPSRKSYYKMPHYLLSFLGTGQYELQGNTRRYKHARYRQA